MTRKSLFLATFIMTMFATVAAHGQSNDVYIDQVGDSLNLVVNQTGDSNNVGGIDDDFTLSGDNMDINIDQTGDRNSIDGQIIKADGVIANIEMIGNTNQFDVDMGATGDVTDSTVDVTVIGDTNVVDLTTGPDNSAIGADIDIAITGSENQMTSIIDSDTAALNADVDGDLNTINTTQLGWSDNSITMALSGSDNQIDILQANDMQPAVINLEGTMSNATIEINQTSAGASQP